MATSITQTGFKAVAFSCLIVLSCCFPAAEIDGFDTQKWKDDRDGCKGSRSNLIEVLLKDKESILGLHEDLIIHWLGRPNKIELYSRDQKIYMYSIVSPDACNSPEKGAETLEIRFNAIGLAKEISLIQ